MLSKHVTKDISAYCHGELSPEEARQFAEHIIACAKCRSEFEEIKLGIKFAEQLPQLRAPASLWSAIETQLGEQKPIRTSSRAWQLRGPLRVAAVAAVLVLVAILGIWRFWDRGSSGLRKESWQVQRIDGAPVIGSKRIGNEGRLGVGEWLETDGSSRAQIAVGSIGTVNIDENTRVRLLETQPTEHRLELARGKMSAMIWAPPRLFFVDTPSAVAADLGCAYTLEVDDKGVGKLRVTSGWVALELKDRESIVPAEAACETRPGVGPGTPYFEDASRSFVHALETFDFEQDATARANALNELLTESRFRDTLTLWHLLARVNGDDRVRVYEKLAGYVPPPAGVTREGILQLSPPMLEEWKDALQVTWRNYGDPFAPKKLGTAPWSLKKGFDTRKW
jgi:putative zinc finger protein/FecR-like protein